MGIIFDRIAHMYTTANFNATPPFPKILMLEPSSGCNLRCRFCSTLHSKRKAKLVDLDFAKNIMQDAFAAGAREIGLYLGGESLLHPGLEQLVRSASDIGYTYIYITTNGVLATRKRLADLIDCGLHSIKFSINATDQDSYAAIHGFAQFDVVMKNLYDAIALREQSIISGKQFYRILVSSVYQDEITDELISFKEKLDRVIDDVILVKEKSQDNNVKKCAMIFNRLHVTADGYLTFCCADFDDMLLYADLNKENIVDAWNGSRAVAFRKKFLIKDLDGTQCGNCLQVSQGPIAALQL